MFQKCVDTLGQPDILVNIAGIKGEQDWEKMYDINVVIIQSLFGNNVVMQHMVSRKGSIMEST